MNKIRAFHNVWEIIPEEKQVWRGGAGAYEYWDIEIGAGVGYHAIQYAQKYPERFLIAIEKTSEKFSKFKHRLEHHSPMPNLVAIQANAIHFIVQNIRNNEIDRYFILYPNPYPKEKQANKRFMHMPFMHEMIKTLKLSGEITLATNKKRYYQEAKLRFTRDFNLKCIEDKALDSTFIPRTHFEKKYLARGEKCFNMIFNK